MKKRLNLLCIIVFLVLGMMLFKTGYDLGTGIYTGMQIAKDHMTELKALKKEGKLPMAFISHDFKEVNLIPSRAMYKPDSILNEKTDKVVPIIYVRAMVDTGRPISTWGYILEGCLIFFSAISIIVAVIYFILLIISINKMTIFDWANVKRLRRIGYALLIFSFCSYIPQFINYFSVLDSMTFQNYILSPTIETNVSDLFLGLGSLIVAEIFAIGLKMKEEQDLTI